VTAGRMHIWHGCIYHDASCRRFMFPMRPHQALDRDRVHEHADHDHHGHAHVHGPASFGMAFAVGIGLNLTFVAVEFTYGADRRRRAQPLRCARAGHCLDCNCPDQARAFVALHVWPGRIFDPRGAVQRRAAARGGRGHCLGGGAATVSPRTGGERHRHDRGGRRHHRERRDCSRPAAKAISTFAGRSCI
jgi:hypothetical protein